MKLPTLMISNILVAASLVACGGSDAKTDAPIDGTVTIDAPGFAMEVNCAGITPSATVTTGAGFAYEPTSSAITIGQVVKFVMIAGTNHNVNSNGKGFDVGFGATKCFKFLKGGTYSFKCDPHSFTGSIVVQ
jgi:hypothetical protein